jgi:hypothetical protein
VGILAAIFAAALMQDLSYTLKTVLVSRGRRPLAVAADISAMLASSLYLILTASVTIRSGLSLATVEAFVAIAVGGACGTFAGMLLADWLEIRLAPGEPRSEKLFDQPRKGLEDFLRRGASALRSSVRNKLNGWNVGLNPNVRPGMSLGSEVASAERRLS